MTKDEQMQKTCCFTGHRRIPADEYETVKLRLRETVIRAIRNGYRYFGTGGSWGFDMLAAQTVLELKEIYPNIYLILVLPCKTQTKYWSDDNKKEYDRIMHSADKVVWTSEEYTRDCMFKRNRHLVDNSSLCICYLTKNTGGTAYTVRYARDKGKTVVYV